MGITVIAADLKFSFEIHLSPLLRRSPDKQRGAFAGPSRPCVHRRPTPASKQGFDKGEKETIIGKWESYRFVSPPPHPNLT